MGLFKRILEVHYTWLTEKGYEERMLEAVEFSGNFREILKAKFAKAIYDSLTDDAIQCFSAAITGRFDERKHCVLFHFQYEYNPETIKLMLKSMTAEMNDDLIEYLIENNKRSALPTADIAYLQLSSITAKKLISKHAGQNVSDNLNKTAKSARL